MSKPWVWRLACVVIASGVQLLPVPVNPGRWSDVGSLLWQLSQQWANIRSTSRVYFGGRSGMNDSLISYPGKLTQCWVNADPPSATLARPQSNIRRASPGGRDLIISAANETIMVWRHIWCAMTSYLTQQLPAGLIGLPVCALGPPGGFPLASPLCVGAATAARQGDQKKPNPGKSHVLLPSTQYGTSHDVWSSI